MDLLVVVGKEAAETFQQCFRLEEESWSCRLVYLAVYRD